MTLTSIPVLLFLIAHFLGDFQFSIQQKGGTKRTSKTKFFQHLLVHGILLAVIILFIPSYWFAGAVILLSHGLIDFFKQFIPGKYEESTFVLGQLLHIVIILGVHSWLNLDSRLVPVWLNQPAVYQWTLLVVIVSKPVNVMFKVLFQNYQPAAEPPGEVKPADENHFFAEVKEKNEVWFIKGNIHERPKQEITETIQGAGANIGTLERILAALLLSVDQYAALGIIFTAKSITRYDKISKDPAFAEYYLIGTLFSIFAVILTYLVIF